jgi:hypothetical protein
MWNIINNKLSLPKIDLFNKVFDIIYSTFKEDSLKRFNSKKGEFSWSFMVPAFDAIAWWIWYNLKEWNIPENCIANAKCIEEVRKRIKALWMSDEWWNDNIKTWWFVEHKLQVVMFVWRKLFNLTEDFWKTEQIISEKIDNLIKTKFN